MLYTYRDRVSKIYVTVLTAIDQCLYWISETVEDEIGITHGEFEVKDFECFEQIIIEAIDSLSPKEIDQTQLNLFEATA